MPKSLHAAQMVARRRLVEELAALLRGIEGDHKAGKAMLTKLARTPSVDDAHKLEKAVRRFVREPATAAPLVIVKQTPTFKDFGLRWATNELHAEYPRYVRELKEKSVKNNKTRVLTLSRVIGDVRLGDFTLENAKQALDELPETAQSAQSVRHYAQVIQTVLRKAVHPAGIIAPKDYPLPVVGFLPKLDAPPSYPILYPSDVVALLRCNAIPTWRRVLYGFATFEGMRLSHILRLRYANVDFANGMITVGKGKNNANARTWELNTGVTKALAWYRGTAAAGDYIFPRLTPNEQLKMASVLREDLVTAGVTRDVRPDLFASGDGQEPMRFHDLRATFVSLHLAMGWSETEVMLRTQHTSSKVLQHHYARRLGVAKAIIKKQGPLLPLFNALSTPKGGGKGGGRAEPGL